MAFSEADLFRMSSARGMPSTTEDTRYLIAGRSIPSMNRPKAISASIGRPIRMANSAPQLLIAIHVPTMGKRNVVVENVKSRTPSKNGVSPAQNVSRLFSDPVMICHPDLKYG
jgi:hypothetical protein